MELASTSAQWFLGARFCKWDFPSEPLLAGCVISSQAGPASWGMGPLSIDCYFSLDVFLLVAGIHPRHCLASAGGLRWGLTGLVDCLHTTKERIIISCLWDHCFLPHMKNSWCCTPAVGISTVGGILRPVHSHLLSHLWEFLWPTSSLSCFSVRLYKCINEHTPIWIDISCFLSCFHFFF